MPVIYTRDVEVDVNRTPLEDLLRLPPSVKEEALEEYFSDETNGAKLRTSDNKAMKVAYSGSWLTIPGNGRIVAKRIAAILLADYGPYGKYYKMDQATGMNRDVWASMNPKQRSESLYNEDDFAFTTQYLYHQIPKYDEDGLEVFEEPTFVEKGTFQEELKTVVPDDDED